MAAPDDFVEVMKVTKHTGLWDAKLVSILLTRFASVTWSTALEYMVLGLSGLA